MSLTQKTKIWHNNAVSRRFGKYSILNNISLVKLNNLFKKKEGSYPNTKMIKQKWQDFMWYAL